MRVRTFWKKSMRRLLERQEQWSLQTRLILSYVLILLIPSVLISLLLFQQFAGSAVKDMERKNENTLEIERLNIANNIETMQRAADLSQADQDVLDYLSRTTEPDTAELIDFSTRVVPAINRLQYNNPNLLHIRIFFDNALINEMYPVFANEERVASEPWFGRLTASKEHMEWHLTPDDPDPFKMKIGEATGVGQAKVAFLKEIEYPLGIHAGILEVDMLMSSFFPKTFGSSEDDVSQLVISDAQGNLFYNRQQKLLASTGISPEALAEALSPAGRALSGTASFRLTLGGQPFLAVSREIEPLGARMVNIVSLQRVLDSARQTRDRIIAANVILIAILGIATYVLNSFILKKLHTLTDSMKRVRQGDFGFDLTVRGGGEVGELAHHFRKMLRKINELIADAVNKKAASKETELRSLKNQIDSHFLYNTLENIKMMAEVEGQYPISDALTSLGGLMRYNLKWTSEYVRLRDEVAHITNYIAIMNIRYENRIILALDIPASLLDQELLKMSLQPIAENAVQHGLRASSMQELTIRIEAEASEGTLVLAVRDDGCGMPADRAAQLNRSIGYEAPESAGTALPRADAGREGGGIGLRNVHQRIQLYYGKEYGLTVASEEGAYTRVVIRIPYFILTGGAG
ncbi:sensor histidine kinase [Cohnella ginsengisoli]|uniref:histidine kinase n=1 Tax=Cohnella ginsengisoli TaxID=425004 RepID=A0A9X4KIS9_9BACL|nr:sensor histidine kinase [Cohnella ginsengisoli]MDG0790500.1 sensor histidine kinase [Cohnella ginsengisoli]